MLLWGLTSIVGLLLLVYSFKLSLIFLVVLGASLLTRVSLRKLLLGLQRGKQESGVVNTFWGSTTLFLISVFSLMAFIYFEEALPRITVPESLVSTALLITVTSFLVGLFILVFLRRVTGFPRWTRNLPILLGLTGLMVLAVLAVLARWFIAAGSGVPPPDAFDVLYRAKITFQGKVLRVQEEYEIQPKSHYLLVSIDDEWLSRNPSVSIGPIRLFEAKDSAGALTGLFVTVDREIEANITEIGLLRRKLELSVWDIPVRVKDLTNTTLPGQEAYTFSLRRISTVSGKLEVRLPQNSYLGSFPEGKLLKLPDRDQFVLDFSNRRPDLELYYLAWPRLGIVRTLLSDSSVPDIVLKTIAFIFWPVVLLLLGATHRSLSDLLIKAIRRKPQRRRAGF